MSDSQAADTLAERILAGDWRAIARAATFIEGRTERGRQLIAAVFPHTGRALTIGVTGPPGAGKSTLVDRMIKALRREGKRVSVLAVDPSSPFSRGAILGDRIRMQDLHDDPGVFIRSMATRGRMGGVAQGTFDLTLLLDAAGFDVVIIETVGVGQDEVEIAGLTDVTLVVLVPGMGDDIQAIKAGMMEIADVFVINKADLPGVERLEQEIRAMQGLGSEAERAAAAPTKRVVARDGVGIEELLSTIGAVQVKRGKRNLQLQEWTGRLREMLRESILDALPEAAIEHHAQLVAEKMEDPYTAVDALLLHMRAGQHNEWR